MFPSLEELGYPIDFLILFYVVILEPLLDITFRVHL